jgi:hypothetical protein
LGIVAALYKRNRKALLHALSGLSKPFFLAGVAAAIFSSSAILKEREWCISLRMIYLKKG